MMGMIKKVFGTKHDRDRKKLQPIADEINRIFGSLAELSDDELKTKPRHSRSGSGKPHETTEPAGMQCYGHSKVM